MARAIAGAGCSIGAVIGARLALLRVKRNPLSITPSGLICLGWLVLAPSLRVALVCFVDDAIHGHAFISEPP